MSVSHDERRQRAVTAPEPPTLDPAPRRRAPVSRLLAPLTARMFPEGLPVRIVFWDGSELEGKSRGGTLTVRSPRALTRIVWSPDELGLARGFVTGEIDFDGDLYAILAALHEGAGRARRLGVTASGAALYAAVRAGAIGLPPERPPEEVRLRGSRHSKRRDAAAITHHYDVGNDFYGLVLGPSMTYSCARFEHDGATLEEAQAAKHELICRKLGLDRSPGLRMLDVGCGWGSMVIHAAAHHGAEAVGITLSPAQHEEAAARVREAELQGRVEIRLQDYRDLGGERFDAISSVGMFEHVGAERMGEYFVTLRSLLGPGGRLLNHAISKPRGSKMSGRTFVNRYVFPDGELIDVARVVGAMEDAGFEVRDVESLREHYTETLRSWVANLERHWDRAVALVGEGRARVWLLYMAGSANGFSSGDLAVHQVLGVVPGPDGSSGMPRTRAGWG